MNIDTNDPNIIDTLLRTEERESTPTLRLAFLPERKDEVFDVLEFDRPELRRSIFKLAHHDDVRLFDFEQGSKEAHVERGELVLRQEPRRGSDGDIGVLIRWGSTCRSWRATSPRRSDHPSHSSMRCMKTAIPDIVSPPSITVLPRQA